MLAARRLVGFRVRAPSEKARTTNERQRHAQLRKKFCSYGPLGPLIENYIHVGLLDCVLRNETGRPDACGSPQTGGLLRGTSNGRQEKRTGERVVKRV